MAAYQRLDVSDGGDVTVARFRDRRIANFLEIEQVGQELYRLLEEGKKQALRPRLLGTSSISPAR